MSRYMLKTGERGQQMMKQTAGLQVNFDFRDEADCIALLRLSMQLSPLLYALFANSPCSAASRQGFYQRAAKFGVRPTPIEPD